jgi:hypothetical protein
VYICLESKKTFNKKFNMQKLKIVFLSTSLLFLFSCKKDKQLDPVATNNNTPANYYDGILAGGITQNVWFDGSLDPNPSAGGDAWFGQSPSPAYSTTNYVRVDSISLNNIFFKFNNFYYVDSAYLVSNLPPLNWHVVGSNGIPSFDYTNTTVMPSYLGYTSFPDSLDHTQNITISLSGISNATKFLFVICDLAGHSVYKDLNISAASVTFSAAELSVLAPGQGYMYVNVKNETPQSFGGKKFRFDNFYQVTKFILIN